MGSMRIHVFTIAWNEEIMMPFFLKHYEQFCERIVVYDNESTDRTPELVKAHPKAELRSWSSGNQIKNNQYLEIKGGAYRESRGIADWVIVCDSDEFLYHRRLEAKLAEYLRAGVDIPQVAGYDMFPDRIPTEHNDLVGVSRFGTRNYDFDKRIVFRPQLDVQYKTGAHGLKSPTTYRENCFPELALLHYKHLSLPYYIARNSLLNARRSEEDRALGRSYHYGYSAEKMAALYEKAYSHRKRVVPETTVHHLVISGIRLAESALRRLQKWRKWVAKRFVSLLQSSSS